MLTAFPGANTGRRGSDLVRFAVDLSVESKQVWLALLESLNLAGASTI